MHRSHRDKRSPSPRHRSSRRRSPSPRREERSSGELPESFSRIHDDPRYLDDQNVLQRMRGAFKDGPLQDLYECIRNNTKLKVFTRNHKEVRGICTGYLLAFDKHWNLAMRDVTEIFLKPRKPKTPYLWGVTQSDIEALDEMEPKVPRKKKKAGETVETEKEGESKSEAEKETEPMAEQETQSEVEKETSASESASEAPAASEGQQPDTAASTEGQKPAAPKKKRKKKKNKDSVVGRRFVDQLFIRGDNVVMAVLLKFEKDEEENEEEQATEEKSSDDIMATGDTEKDSGKLEDKPEQMDTEIESDKKD